MRYAVLGLCLFATACAGSDAGAPTAPSSPPGEVGVTEATRGSELPFRGTLESIEVHTGAFPILHSVLTGTGQATHLGRYTVGFVFDITIGVGSPSATIGTLRSQRPTETVSLVRSLAPVLSPMAWSRLWRTPPSPKGRAGLLTRPGASGLTV